MIKKTSFDDISKCPCAKCKHKIKRVYDEPCRSCTVYGGWQNFEAIPRYKRIFKFRDD